MRRKIFSILLSLAMVVTMMPAMTMTAFAETKDLTVTKGGAPATEGVDYLYSSNDLYISSDGLTVSGTTAGDFIIVQSGVSNITLSNLYINGATEPTAFESKSEDLTINLVGDNRLGNEVVYEEGVTQASDYDVQWGIKNVSGKNINFTGSGNLAICSKYSGIQVGNLTSDTGFTGKLTVESFGAGGNEAIDVSPKCTGPTYDKGGNIDLQGGEFNIVAHGDEAVYVSDGYFNLKDSEMTVLAVAAAFYVYADINPNGGEFSVENSTLNANAVNSNSASDAHCKAIEAAGNIEIINSTVNAKATSAYEGNDEETFGIMAGTDISVSGDGTNITTESSCNGTVYGIAATSSLYINGGTVKVKAASADTTYAFFSTAGITIANTHKIVNGTLTTDLGKVYINATDQNAEGGFVIIKPINDNPPGGGGSGIFINPDDEEEKLTDEEIKKSTEVKKVSTTKIKALNNGKITIWFNGLKLKGVKKVTKYQIQRRVKGGKFKTIATITRKGTKNAYTNVKNLKKGETYYYRVRGVSKLSTKSSVFTKWSKAVSAKCLKTR